MTQVSGKTKLTVTINKDVLENAKRICEDKHVPLSGAIENFLRFFIDPFVYCFKCGEEFRSKQAKICAICGWMVCPYCESCGCGLDEATAKAVFYMRRVYEDLVIGRVK